MKKYQKSIIFIIFAVLFAGVSFFLLQNNKEYFGYAVLGFTFAGIFLITAITSFFNNHNPNRFYESKVRDILNTYDSILVKSSTVPALEGRNIILVESVDDLIDAQLELRKPICYLKQTESCSFILLDDKEAYVYIEKLNDDVESPVEIELNELRIKSRNADEMDSEMLRNIERTTIVKLSNKKSYKVSPVRKNKQVEENRTMETQVANENTEVVASPVAEEVKVDTPVVTPPVTEEVKVDIPVVASPITEEVKVDTQVVAPSVAEEVNPSVPIIIKEIDVSVPITDKEIEIL